MRGAPLIVAIEGTDGSGKTTLCEGVTTSLRARGLAVASAADARRPLRQAYRSLIADPTSFPDPRTSILLGLADYSHLLAWASEQAADVVLLDRCAYSACADAVALGVDLERVLSLMGMFGSPDMLFFLDLEPEAALERKGGVCSVAEAGGPTEVSRHPSLHESFVAYQTRVRDAYALLFEARGRGESRCTVSADGARVTLSRTVVTEVQRAHDARRSDARATSHE